VSGKTAQAVERRIVAEAEALPAFPERSQTTDRLSGMRERDGRRVPHVVFVKVVTAAIVATGRTIRRAAVSAGRRSPHQGD
jgi:hypothetical protein